MPPHTAPAPRFDAIPRRVGHMGEGDRKDLGHLAGFSHGHKRPLDPGQDRRYRETGHRFMHRQGAQHPGRARWQAHLFARLAQGRRDHAAVAVFDLAAGKGDLAGVVFQGRRPLGQQQACPVGPKVCERHQHPGRAQAPTLGQHDVGVQIKVRAWVAAAGQRCLEPGQDLTSGHLASPRSRTPACADRTRNARHRTGSPP